MIAKDMKFELGSGEVLKFKNYIANDGKEFGSEAHCIQHDKKLDAKEKIKHIPFKTSSIMGFDSWYYISSYADFEALRNYIAIVIQDGMWTDFDVYDLKNRFVNDWVSYTIEKQEDNADCCIFKSFNEIQEDFSEIQRNFKELEKVLNGHAT